MDWSLNSNGTNNAVIASLVTPGTNFGVRVAPVFRNVYIEDPPLRLFSLRIMPPDCSGPPRYKVRIRDFLIM